MISEATKKIMLDKLVELTTGAPPLPAFHDAMFPGHVPGKATKEQLRATLAGFRSTALDEAAAAFERSEPIEALAWGTKVPLLDDLAERARRAKYETGPEVEEIARGAHAIMNMLDPRGERDSRAYLRTDVSDARVGDFRCDFRAEHQGAFYRPPPCARCNEPIDHRKRVSRKGHDYCSTFCAQDFGEMVPPTSKLGIARSVMSAVYDQAPMGVSPKEVLKIVAELVGII